MSSAGAFSSVANLHAHASSCCHHARQEGSPELGTSCSFRAKDGNPLFSTFFGTELRRLKVSAVMTSSRTGNVLSSKERFKSITVATLMMPDKPGKEKKPSFKLDSDDDWGSKTTTRSSQQHHVGMVVKILGEDLDPTSSKPKKRIGHPTLVLMRHGESMWNDLKLFTGDVDIPLTERGVMEALSGGKSVADIDFDLIFTSRLVRSKQTALLAMTQNAHKAVPVIVRGGYYGKGKTGDENRLRLRFAAAQALRQAECRMVPVYADPALNERSYGDLQGLNKEAAIREYGPEMVAKWRRSHDTRPPQGESLQDTWVRTMNFFASTIEPRLDEGKNVLVVAHGNVLRCIISYICNLTELEMLRLHVVTALPYSFAYDGGSYAQCCFLPPIDPITKQPSKNIPLGITSVLQRGEVDSLI